MRLPLGGAFALETCETKVYNRAEQNVMQSEERKEWEKIPSGAQQIHEKNIAPLDTASAPPRPHGSAYMGNYAAPPLEKIRVAMIGLGARGMALLRILSELEDYEVVALCDTREEARRSAAVELRDRGKAEAASYGGSEDAYLYMLARERPDAVFIDTPWELHARMAVECMERGAHVFVEVPLATTLEELWTVVDAVERTQKHCMMLEEVIYGRHELMFLNMVRQGLVGDLLHGEAAYIHDLRDRTMSSDAGGVAWRVQHYAGRNGNLYPTHGLAPVAQYMSIARGEDTFERIVSLSSPSIGFSTFAGQTFPSAHPWNNTDFLCGDMNTSIIRTRLGRTILVQWDETTPRPYDRKNLIQGTAGVLADFPLRVIGSFVPDEKDAADHSWYTGKEAWDDLYARFDHPLYRRLGDKLAPLSPRVAMDYIMLYRIMESLKHGTALDQNVYEAALLSAVGPLTEKSVHEGGTPQIFPDFTRGDWQHTKRASYLSTGRTHLRRS